MNDKAKTLEIIGSKIAHSSKRISVGITEKKVKAFFEDQFAKNPGEVQEWAQVLFEDIKTIFNLKKFWIVGTPEPPDIPSKEAIGRTCVETLPVVVMLILWKEYFYDHPKALHNVIDKHGLAMETPIWLEHQING